MRGWLAIICWGFAGSVLAQDGPTWDDVGPVFAERCVTCHSRPDAPLGLVLADYESILKGAEAGPVLIAGDPEGSKLIRRLKGLIEPRMPLDGPPFLETGQVEIIRQWISAGMPGGTGIEAPVEIRARPQPGDPVVHDDVQAIFNRRCVICHSDNSKLGRAPEGLRLGTLGQILAGGERAVVIPGRPELSAIWRRITGLESPRMPFDGPPWLSDDDVRIIRDWIAQGAVNSAGLVSPVKVGAKVRMRGILSADNAIDGGEFTMGPGVRIDKKPQVGRPAEMRGIVNADGTVRATRLRRR